MSHALKWSCFLFLDICTWFPLVPSCATRAYQQEGVVPKCVTNDTEDGKWAQVRLFIFSGSQLMGGCVGAEMTDTVCSAWWWLIPKIYLPLGRKRAGKMMSLGLCRLPRSVSWLCHLLGKPFLSRAGLEKTSSFDSVYLHIQMLCVHVLVVLACKPSNVVKSLLSCCSNPVLSYHALLWAGGCAPSWRASPAEEGWLLVCFPRIQTDLLLFFCCIPLVSVCGQNSYCLFLFSPCYLIFILLPC